MRQIVKVHFPDLRNRLISNAPRIFCELYGVRIERIKAIDVRTARLTEVEDINLEH